MDTIGILTTSRSDYGLLEPLIKLAHLDKKLCLFVAGSHCSPEFGLTINHIKYPISERLDTLMSSDTEPGIIKSAGMTMIGMADALARHKLKWLVLLGDRFETLASAMAARIARIPIAHISGGEITGNYDDSFRHSITQLSSIHFVYCDEYKKRVVQMGNNPDTVHTVGFLGLDGLKKRDAGKVYNHILISYHPETLKNRLWMQSDIRTLLGFLADHPENMTFTIPNADNGGRFIRKEIEDFCQLYNRAELRSLTRDDFIDFICASDVLVGNSSAGIYEAPALGVPSINIGDRQRGRLQAPTIINSDMTVNSLGIAFDALESKLYQAMLQEKYPLFYYGKDSAKQIYHILNSTEGKIEKEWYA